MNAVPVCFDLVAVLEKPVTIHLVNLLRMFAFSFLFVVLTARDKGCWGAKSIKTNFTFFDQRRLIRHLNVGANHGLIIGARLAGCLCVLHFRVALLGRVILHAQVLIPNMLSYSVLLLLAQHAEMGQISLLTNLALVFYRF